MKKFLVILLILLPITVLAQRQYREMYWLYYNLEGSAYIERSFKYGGYEDKLIRSTTESYRAYLSDSARIEYDRQRMEFAKTLVFYTEDEIKRGPVKLKPKDWYNKAVRAGKEVKAVFLL